MGGTDHWHLLKKNMFIRILLAIFCFSAMAAFLSGCGGSATTPTAGDANTTGSHDMSAHNGATTDVDRAFKVDFRSEPGVIQAGTPATLVFTVKDKQGAVVKDLQIVHEKPMHLLIVSRDLAEFYHVHPEQSADGSYRVQHTFPSGGDYRLYADFTPKDAVQVVERVDAKVAGQERAKEPLVADASYTKTEGGLRVVMKPDGELKGGAEVMLNFQAFDAASGNPATDLQNYLGELAHFVIISEDMEDFVHAHPMSKGEHGETGKKEQSGDHNADGHQHSTMGGTTLKPSASEVSAHTSFPRSGLYKIWAQFQRGGQVVTVPFVVDIAAGEQRAELNPADVPAGATLIKLSGDGYEPASVTVNKGEPVRLAFYRADADNCGGEVEFPSRKIKKKLPVGKPVVVEFTPETTGEIAFACGMGMYKGKVVVQ